MYRPHKARHTALLLRQQPDLAKLLNRVGQVNAWQAAFERHVEPGLCEHCRVSAFEAGALRLVADSGAWASRLYYQQSLLIRRLGTEPLFQGLQRILVRVDPHRNNRLHSAPRHSNPAAQALLGSAEGIRDTQLQAALRRLASHVKAD